MNISPAKPLIFILVIVLCLALIAGSCYWAMNRFACMQGRCPVSEVYESPEQGVRITLWSPKRLYTTGEQIHIVSSIENLSGQLITIESKDGAPVFDLTYIEFESGKTITWSDAHSELANTTIELQPGEKFQVEWDIVPRTENEYGFKVFVWLQQGTVEASTTLLVSYGHSYIK